MDKRQQLDLNLENWSVDDLYELFEIPKTSTTNEVADMSDKVISRQTSGSIKYFLQTARNKIIRSQSDKLEGDAFGEDTDRQLKEWWRNQYLESGDAVQNDKSTVRSEKVEIFDDNNGHYQMKRNKLGINNTHNISHIQGTINPTLVNEIERTVIIDSQYRTNIYPYSGGSGYYEANKPSSEKSGLGNPTSPSFNTDFTLSLSENLTDVIELKLDSVSIPQSWFNFSPYMGNSRFAIEDSSSNKIFMVHLPEMSPDTMAQLVTIINDIIVLEFTTNYPYIVNDIHFSSDLTTRRISISPKIDASGNYLGSGTAYKIIWYDSDLFYKNNNALGEDFGTTCINVEYPNNNLGWYLGYRPDPDEQNIVSMSYTAISGTDTGPARLLAYTVADTVPTLKSINYLVIVLDEFNKNRLNTGIVSGVQESTKLPIPSYITNDNLNCDGSENKPFFSKVAPRKLTQAQLYTINTIIEDRKKAKERNTAPTLSDAFCTIPVPSNIDNTDNIVLYSNQLASSVRKYFGPVNIERVRARLYDDKGNIVNLKGKDWSFTLKVKQLYQY